ncbi:hypothetical protein FISHEDRAFT_74876 [Fistulina hepatica ATCC 64428]|uniref:Uncharacterized protein n=1 Tax=Fistulina hepatica ATCC 64428 TaxID=1128425 RepID=A0A0D7A8S6_9AGAR|nr:hypothetical protein FISHEDRAFT_74876 [Fistulina hepatica ATCC 64428]
MSSPHEASDSSQLPTGVQTEAIAACESVVERFRVGDISKARAIVEIQHHIPYSGSFDDEERLAAHSATIESFLRKLDGFEHIQGATEARGSSGEVEQGTLRRERSAPAEHEQEETTGRTLKRARAESDEEDADNLLPAGKKLDIARLPWNSRKQSCTVESAALSPTASRVDARITSILRTVEILGFPDSQWTKLLSRGTADFDQVISGLFAEAFTFIFAHRAEELRAYASHVKAFFKARPISEHSGVIAYDSAVYLQIRFIFSPAASTLGASGRNAAPAPPVITPTSAINAEPEGMWKRIVKKSREFMWRYSPKYARNLVWFSASEEETPPKKESLADTSLTLKPVPTPPVKVLTNAATCSTITAFPDLFPIVTPINVSNFKSLLRDHLNRPLVESVCRSLREGFWLWASTAHDNYPDTYDNAEGYRTLTDPVQLAFARKQCAAEVEAGRFSPSFGPNLLPGMYAVPIWVVPKPHSDGLRLIVDHSAGKFSLNSMIPKSERSVHLDGLQQLGEALISAREQYPDRPLVVWKADVTHAYCILPMHPFWQIKQTVKIDDTRHVDFDNDFRGGGSGRIWSIFFALVLWIATYLKCILDLFAYVDDTFSWDFADNLAWYEPYEAWYPKKQVMLLHLWDFLGVPHEKKKQEWGPAIVVIGLLVDAVDMSVMMPDQSRRELIATLRAFAIPGQRCPLVEFQRLGGWINWALNVYPLLRPGLNTLYAKTKDKTQPFQAVWVSKALCSELWWIANHLEMSTGVHMLESRRWGPSDADVVVFTDACLTGMSFFFPASHIGFQCETDLVMLLRGISRDRIFYFEALAVVTAIVHTLTLPNPPHCLLVWSDNTNTVDIFNSLHASPSYNPLLITVVDLLMLTNCDLRVLHVAGENNKVANALSRFQNDVATRISPNLHILPFIPPRLTSGAPLQ